MDINIKPQRFTTQLPPVPCTPDLRTQVRQIAQAEKVSMAQIQRTALMFFLHHYVRSAEQDNPLEQKEVNDSFDVTE